MAPADSSTYRSRPTARTSSTAVPRNPPPHRSNAESSLEAGTDNEPWLTHDQVRHVFSDRLRASGQRPPTDARAPDSGGGRVGGTHQAGGVGQLSVGLGASHGYVLRAGAWGAETYHAAHRRAARHPADPEIAGGDPARWAKAQAVTRRPSTTVDALAWCGVLSAWRSGQPEDLDARSTPGCAVRPERSSGWRFALSPRLGRRDPTDIGCREATSAVTLRKG